ncbi:hypothetical protein EON83_29965 [bacterium]|nr:MAG: hypothetical protein EON83_29965 [bacterium]
MMEIPEKARPAITIIGTCMLAGPAIGVIFVYIMVVAMFIGVSLWLWIQGIPSMEDSMVLTGLIGGLAMLPIFAMVGAIYTAPLTLTTGVVLSIAHYAKLLERIARQFHLPLLALQVPFGFLAGAALTTLLGYKKLPEAMNSLLGIHIVAGVAGAVCAPIASYLLTKHQNAKNENS